MATKLSQIVPALVAPTLADQLVGVQGGVKDVLFSRSQLGISLGAGVVNVADFLAKGDSSTDDVPAIQAAINSLPAAGGTVEFMDGRNYLLNSFTIPPTDSTFSYNLHVPSNVTLQAPHFATLTQGPLGRRNAAGLCPMIIMSPPSTYPLNAWQTVGLNGGFYAINATHIADRAITLTTSAQAANFTSGQWIYIVSATVGDVIPSETNRVVTSNSITGVVTLQYPITRAFATPSVVNVDNIAQKNNTLRNLLLQGQQTISFRGMINLICENVDFCVNCAYSNNGDFDVGTGRGFIFDGCTFRSINGSQVPIQILQRNCMDAIIKNSTIIGQGMGTGEYMAHFKITDNTFYLNDGGGPYPTPYIGFEGQDVLFQGNTIYGGALTGGTEQAGIYMDFNAPPAYMAFCGENRILDNNFTIAQPDNNVIVLSLPDTICQNNFITIEGASKATGIRCTNRNLVTGNVIKTGSGFASTLDCLGIFVYCSFAEDAGTITENVIIGTAPGTPANYFGIFVYDSGLPSGPATGTLALGPNHISGFTTKYNFALANHPAAYFEDGGPLIMQSGAITAASLNLTSTALSASPTTGALQVAGGIGVGGNISVATNSEILVGVGGGMTLVYNGSNSYFILARTGPSINFFQDYTGNNLLELFIANQNAGAGAASLKVDGGLDITGNVRAAQGMVNSPLTFATLPLATAGTIAYITDGLAANCSDGTCTTFGTHITGGGGTLHLAIWYNGTNWTLLGK